jgi:threonine dehydrogenase-like Zn-dependent dehydrogenase
MYETWVQMTALLRGGRVNLEPLFGERRAFDSFEDAFGLLQNGFAGKVLLTPN